MHKLQVQQLHQKTEILKQEIYSVNAMQLLCPTTTKQLFWATSEEWKLRKRRFINHKYYKTGNLISCCVPLDGDIIGVILITETFCLEFSLIVLLKVGKWKQKPRNKKLNPLWMETVLGAPWITKNSVLDLSIYSYSADYKCQNILYWEFLDKYDLLFYSTLTEDC